MVKKGRALITANKMNKKIIRLLSVGLLLAPSALTVQTAAYASENNDAETEMTQPALQAITSFYDEMGNSVQAIEQAAPGEQVSLFVAVQEGYTFKEVTAKKASGKKVELTWVNEHTATFTMPDEAVTLTGVFELLPVEPEPVPEPEIPVEPEPEAPTEPSEPEVVPEKPAEPAQPEAEAETKPETKPEVKPETEKNPEAEKPAEKPAKPNETKPNKQETAKESNKSEKTKQKTKKEKTKKETTKKAVESFLAEDQNVPVLSNQAQQAIVNEAFRHIGKDYVWGAKGPGTFDCSGLAYYVYMKATGKYIGGWTGDQQFAGTQIPVSEAQPGDLLFWGSATSPSYHVAIYIGNDQFIHAPEPGTKVRVDSLGGYRPDYAVRVKDAGLQMPGSLFEDPVFQVDKNQTTEDFIKKIAEDARELGLEHNVYASVMIAQAILESGSGNSGLASEPYYNLFGIKGEYEGESVAMRTNEHRANGDVYTIVANFRAYPSYKESLEDYIELIQDGLTYDEEFYRGAWKDEAESYEAAAEYLQGRYATDVNYAKKLVAIIEAYDLEQYDHEAESEEKAEVAVNTIASVAIPLIEHITTPTWYVETTPDIFTRDLPLLNIETLVMGQAPKSPIVATAKVAAEETKVSNLFANNILSLINF